MPSSPPCHSLVSSCQLPRRSSNAPSLFHREDEAPPRRVPVHRQDLPANHVRSGGKRIDSRTEVGPVLRIHSGVTLFNHLSGHIHDLDRVEFIFEALVEPELHRGRCLGERLGRVGSGADQLGMCERLRGDQEAGEKNESTQGDGYQLRQPHGLRLASNALTRYPLSAAKTRVPSSARTPIILKPAAAISDSKIASANGNRSASKANSTCSPG